MSSTIFQRIIAREIPATFVYEDDRVAAIRDIAPAAPVHILIIPREPVPSVAALEEEHAALVGHIFTVARRIAETEGIATTGYRVVTNIGDDGGQTVPHLHFHLLGGRPLGAMVSAPAPAAPTGGTVSGPKGIVREAGLLLLLAVGLAVGYNTMNGKRIPWVKKAIVRDAATTADVDRYVAAPTTVTAPTTTPTTTTAAPTVGTTPAATPPPAATTPTAAVNPTAATAPTAATPAPTAFQAQPGVVKEIGLPAFRKLLTAPHFLIDARTTESYAKGHIGNAVNYYGGEAEGLIPQMLETVPRDRVILIYCDGGECELSHHVADVLVRFGFGPIFIFTGGWKEWSASK